MNGKKRSIISYSLMFGTIVVSAATTIAVLEATNNGFYNTSRLSIDYENSSILLTSDHKNCEIIIKGENLSTNINLTDYQIQIDEKDGSVITSDWKMYDKSTSSEVKLVSTYNSKYAGKKIKLIAKNSKNSKSAILTYPTLVKFQDWKISKDKDFVKITITGESLPCSKNISEYYEIKVDDTAVNSFELFSPKVDDENLHLNNEVVLKMKFDEKLAGKNVEVSIKDSLIKNVVVEKGNGVAAKPYPSN